MRRLREQFPNELVVIGIHSAKFPSEHLTANIREAVLRHDIRHPVANDAGFQIWSQYAVRGWPTIVLIDPEGYYVGSQSGEIQAEALEPTIKTMIEQAEQKGVLDRRPLELQPEMVVEPARPLSYPSKLLATSDGRLFVADTGHHRILELQLTEDGTAGEIRRVFGSGAAGLKDGPPSEAAFRGPHGLALEGETLYVADTDNHAIRAIDLGSGRVRTVAGTGQKAHGRFTLGPPTSIPLRSPWDLYAEGGVVFIAMAGSHQIWVLLNEEQLGPFAGSGYEALVDGARSKAGFNQPSGLAAGGAFLFVADAEASAIRAIVLDPEAPVDAQVRTLVGEGLFDFGDVDGTGPEVRLQHPTGIAYADGAVFIADSYNHKIKRLNPSTGSVATLIGSGMTGHADGLFDTAQLFEPEGVSPMGRLLYIADTNNHLVRVADLEVRTLRILVLRGLDRLHQASVEERASIRLEPVTLGRGNVTLTLDIPLPPGYKLNPQAPRTLREAPDGEVRTFGPVEAPSIDLHLDSDRTVVLDLTLYPCQEQDERLCLIHDARLIVPVHVVADGPTDGRIQYRPSLGHM